MVHDAVAPVAAVDRVQLDRLRLFMRTIGLASNHYLTLARPVELDHEDALPSAEREASVDHGNRLAGRQQQMHRKSGGGAAIVEAANKINRARRTTRLVRQPEKDQKQHCADGGGTIPERQYPIADEGADAKVRHETKAAASRDLANPRSVRPAK